MIKNWIFVTGAPRGGTTFAGVVLSRPISVDYIHEPFNPDCGIPGITHRYSYVERGSENEPDIRDLIRDLQRYDFSLRTALYPRDSRMRRVAKRMIGSRGPFYLRMAKLNPVHRAAVVKDPIGCLLTQYLVEEYGFHALVLIRHPLAFVASVLRLRWDIQAHLDDLRRQPTLTARYFSDEPEFLSRRGRTPIEDAAILWRALNKVLLIQAASTPAIIVKTHEAISLHPAEEFRRLYDAFHLPWSARVERFIRRMTTDENRAEARAGKVQDFARASAKLLDLRIDQLEREDRRGVFEIVRDIASPMYDEGSFRI